jgi:hypothetical protein
MKTLIVTILLQYISCTCLAQTNILQGDLSINKSFLKSRTTIMEYSSSQNGSALSLVGNYKIEVAYSAQTLDVKTTLSFKNKNTPWIDHLVTDATSFNPISLASQTSSRSLKLNFGNEITGSLQDYNRGTKTTIKEKSKASYFDKSIYPFTIPALPLKEGYKATIPVFDFEALESNKKYSNVLITGVYSVAYRSNFTGTHKVWRVEVFEESTQQTLKYFFDQKTGRFWKLFFRTANGILIELKNNESDYNPLKSRSDKEATLKLITQGKSIIKGQAFAKDNKNGGALQRMAVLNVNKKQVAPKSTKIVLTPYTCYFKEWNKTNEVNYKKIIPPLPLPEGTEECFIETSIFDDEGHFEFSNLMPGEYLITTVFEYEHSATSTSVVGYTDYYTNGIYQGSNEITNSRNFIADAKAKINKVATVKNDGEVVETKLKKTL